MKKEAIILVKIIKNFIVVFAFMQLKNLFFQNRILSKFEVSYFKLPSFCETNIQFQLANKFLNFLYFFDLRQFEKYFLL